MDDSRRNDSNQPLKIAVFSDSALPVLNGVSISIEALIRELRNQGHSVHLYAPRFPGFRDPDPNTYRFRAMETPISRGYPCAYPPFYRMLRKFRQHSYDIVHSHTPFLMGMVGFRWAESHDIPIVSTYHTLYDRYSHYFKLLPRRYVRYRIAKHTNFYYNQVDHVITPSEAALKWLLRHSVHSPVTVIPTGIPAAQVVDRSEARQRLGMSPEHRILLYVGRLAQEKNLPLLLEGASFAMAHDPSIRLWLVGDGPFRQECTRIVRELGIGDKVRFVGFIDRERIDEYYASADLFLFASVTETQGLVIQEAMRHGLPSVVVAGGGAGNAIESGVTGFLVRNDPVDLANQIRDVFDDEGLYAEMSEAALRSSRSHGIPDMAARVVAVYRDTIRQRRPNLAAQHRLVISHHAANVDL